MSALVPDPMTQQSRVLDSPPVQVEIDDLIDSHQVAELLGLRHPNSVSTYMHRYDDFPPPIFQSRTGRSYLWSRIAITFWSHGHRSVSRS